MIDSSETIRVLLVDDHPVVADGVRAMLADEGRIEVVAAALSAAVAHELIERERPDVVVCDAEVGADSGFEILRRHRDEAAFVIFSAFDRRSYLQQAFDEGAHGYVVKGAPGAELVAAIRAAAAGEYRFSADLMRAVRDRVHRPTGRLLEVVRLTAEALSNEQVAHAMRISPKTVEGHLRTLFDRYGVASRTELAMLAVREGWISSGEGGAQP
jgi:DNA-binding NarL/FixJ family response regulator